MIKDLIEQAEKIEDETDANIHGALFQVTNNLTVSECEEIFIEQYGDNERKADRYAKKITRVKSKADTKMFNVHGLRNDVSAILEAELRKR